jgi:hypothetical protein
VAGLSVSGNLVVFQVVESGQGGINLNGDSDTTDSVLHVYDAATATLTNVGLAVSGTAVSGNLVAFRVQEAAQGSTNLNGDGDTTDLVVHVYDTSTAITTNLGLAIANFEFHVDGSVVAIRVPEPLQGGDLNGDGDATDSVIHVYDADTATLTNLGLASAELRHSGNLVAFRVVESAQGATDFNGDGDAIDGVVLVYDATTGSTTILAAATFVDAVGDLVAYTVSEFGQRATDFNGDGDIADAVVHVYDAANASTTNLGLASGGFVRLSGDMLAFPVREASQGGSNLNGDGDILDLVAHVARRTNPPPVNTTPAAQATPEDVALTFSAANGNAISISDPDAGLTTIQVTLSATNGRLTLSTITGLTFSAGDGSGDATVSFTGTQAAINAALDGLVFAPTNNFNGTALLSLTTNDLGNNGLGIPRSDGDSVSIAVLSVAEQIANLKEHVDGQVAAGTLNKGQGNALNTKLCHALEKFQRGQINVAINQLNAFIHQVQAFIAGGVLTAAEGNPLLADVNSILWSIQH